MKTTSWKLPDASSVAEIVSQVTEVMCGAHFLVANPLARGESMCARMYLLPLVGQPAVSIVLGCDRSAAHALARAIFAGGGTKVTDDLAQDAVRELLNIIGGRIRNVILPEHSLGLPRPTNLGEMVQLGGLKLDDGALLRSKGTADLIVWVFEHQAPRDVSP